MDLLGRGEGAIKEKTFSGHRDCDVEKSEKGVDAKVVCDVDFRGRS